MNEQEQPLASLRGGEMVAFHAGTSEDYRLYQIKEVSRGIITLSNGERFRVKDGSRMKEQDRYAPARIEPVTDAIRHIMRKNRLVNQLSGLNYNHWKAMPVETLEAIAVLVWKEQES